MRYWVGVTDNSWFAFLSRLQPDEVNFWQPSGKAPAAVDGVDVFKVRRGHAGNFAAMIRRLSSDKTAHRRSLLTSTAPTRSVQRDLGCLRLFFPRPGNRGVKLAYRPLPTESYERRWLESPASQPSSAESRAA